MNRPASAVRGNGAVGIQERAQRSASGVAASLERVAALHAELAAAYRAMAVEIGDIQLAASPEPSLMCDVPTPTPGPELMTADDLAERLRVTPKTIRRWRSEGRLPDAIEIAGVLRWRRAEFEQWLAEAGS